jgi:hypothetical protein
MSSYALIGFILIIIEKYSLGPRLAALISGEINGEEDRRARVFTFFSTVFRRCEIRISVFLIKMPIAWPCCLRQVPLLALGQWDRGQILRRAEFCQKLLFKCAI